MHFFVGPGWGWGRRYYGPGGCISGIITSIVLLLVVGICLVASLFSAPQIEKSTIGREKLDAGYVKAESNTWYSDEKHLAITVPVREAEMMKSMQYFYEMTGVQPYLYISNNLDGNYNPLTADFQEFGEKLYDELFGLEDGGHVILICVQSASKSNQYFTIDAEWYVGKDAATILDTEAHDIFFDYMSLYFDQYYYDGSIRYYEDVFGKTFNDSADRIMHVTKVYEDWSAGVWISIVGGVIILVIILVSAFGKSRKKDNRDDSTYTRSHNTNGGNDNYSDRDYSKY